MTIEEQIHTISLLDKSLQIKCPPDKAEDLKLAAQYLDNKMREIRDGNRSLGNEQIATLVALNISYDLLIAERQKEVYIDAMGTRIRDLTRKIDIALAQQQEPV